MRIEHIALWVQDLEKMKTFYEQYFEAQAGKLYINPNKHFKSYFLSFGKSQVRLEIMQMPGIKSKAEKRGFDQGLAHFAVSVGSKERVEQLTDTLRKEGYALESEPRTTGDGYYESVVLDPEGNYLEITV